MCKDQHEDDNICLHLSLVSSRFSGQTFVQTKNTSKIKLCQLQRVSIIRWTNQVNNGDILDKPSTGERLENWQIDISGLWKYEIICHFAAEKSLIKQASNNKIYIFLLLDFYIFFPHRMGFTALNQFLILSSYA